MKYKSALVVFLFLTSLGLGSEDGQLSDLKARAENGDIEAQYDLGMIYERGGHLRNYAEALKWYKKAAEQEHPQAQTNLGAMYYSSQSVEQDYTKAYKWTRKAAEQGDAIAQLNLGVMYFKGEGVSQDYVWAYTWVSLAAVGGESTSQNHLEKFKKEMTEEQIAEAKHRAETWLAKHQKK